MLQGDELKIKLAFDPCNMDGNDRLSSEDKLHNEMVARLFRCDDLPLKIWAIIKMNFLTCQYFIPAMDKIQRHCHEARERGLPIWDGIAELFEVMEKSGIYRSFCFADVLEIKKLMTRHWDYLNPNIKKRMYAEYTKKDGTLVIKPIGNKPDTEGEFEDEIDDDK